MHEVERLTRLLVVKDNKFLQRLMCANPEHTTRTLHEGYCKEIDNILESLDEVLSEYNDWGDLV